MTSRIKEAIKASGNNIIAEIGLGHSEKIYQRCLAHDLAKNYDFKIEVEKTFQIIFDGVCIGYYIPDMVIDDNIIVELKNVQSITNGAKAQLQKYTKYCEHALIVNFPARFDIKNVENVEIYELGEESELKPTTKEQKKSKKVEKDKKSKKESSDEEDYEEDKDVVDNETLCTYNRWFTQLKDSFKDGITENNINDFTNWIYLAYGFKKFF
jgi:GxxExxY protein